MKSGFTTARQKSKSWCQTRHRKKRNNNRAPHFVHGGMQQGSPKYPVVWCPSREAGAWRGSGTSAWKLARRAGPG